MCIIEPHGMVYIDAQDLKGKISLRDKIKTILIQSCKFSDYKHISNRRRGMILKRKKDVEPLVEEQERIK